VGEKVRGLTLYRPWDEPVVAGAKPIENRPNPPPRSLLGQVVAIHAGKVWDPSGAAFIRARGYRLLGDDGAWVANRVGAIVGVARIAGWLDRRPQSIQRGPDGEETGTVVCLDGPGYEAHGSGGRIRIGQLDQSSWWFGPVGILLVDAVAIAPVPCRGMQGWWKVPADVEAVVRERVEAARAA
jgi:hypothetical protein